MKKNNNKHAKVESVRERKRETERASGHEKR